MPQFDLTATPAALAHLKKMLARESTPYLGIRLAVKNSGCSGKSYVISLVDAVSSGDLVCTLDVNMIACTDPESYVYLSGTVIDYERKGVNGKLVFRNPHEKASCGCGESFHV